jgi:hypothetical protein
LVVPVGLEKHVAGNPIEIVKKMREPIDVSVFQAAAGGIGGAEGSVRLICRGPRQKVEKALKLAEQIQGEPPFVE